MAAKTPDSVRRESIGSQTRLDCVFSSTNIDNGDTYTPGVTGIKNVWFSASSTTGMIGCSESGGVITFATDVDDQLGTLYIEGDF